jgi:hypothetical protein
MAPIPPQAHAAVTARANRGENTHSKGQEAGDHAQTENDRPSSGLETRMGHQLLTVSANHFASCPHTIFSKRMMKKKRVAVCFQEPNGGILFSSYLLSAWRHV